jgi:hypothetical protein
MTTQHRFNAVDLLVAIAGALLVSWVLIYLAEYFDLPLVREAGGRVV